jgi:beta-glucosidase-like glycosyl hydrolase/CubicO group peptidase (beta-lactamase class C family)
MQVQKWMVMVIMLHLPFAFQSLEVGTYELERQEAWVTSTFEAMELEEQLGQLFMIRAFSKGEIDHEKKIEKLIQEEHIGGLCFFQGNPKYQVELTQRFQEMSKVPLLISIDAEWGLGMRFKDQAISFPRQMTLGAIRNNRLIYDMGKEVARQLRRMGIHINFAPVVDVNNNPQNPVINNRSFGESRRNVTAKGFSYMKGMQDGGILACAKHFPGHGDTEVDSHKDLPIIPHGLSRLDSLELFPFKVLSQYGIASMMIAHLQVPALDQRENTPTTLSYATVTEKLKNDLEFNGLIFTDALDMRGVTKHHEAGQLEVEAFAAGNDILLLSEAVKEAKAGIILAIKEGRLPLSRVEESVKKILRAKYQLGLLDTPALDAENVYKDINSSGAYGLKGKLYQHAFTCVRDSHNVLPVGMDVGNLASLALGTGTKTFFQKRMSAYYRTSHFTGSLQLSQARAQGLLRALSDKDMVIISLHDYNKSPSNNHGINEQTLWLIDQLRQRTEVVLVPFGSPYVLRLFDRLPAIVQAYEEDDMAQDYCAQALFGVFDIHGILPVRPSKAYALGQGKIVKGNGRLGYAIPEVVGLSTDTLEKMDTIALEMIDAKAAPGCQVLVAKAGKVVFHRAYGYHDYNQSRRVQLNDLYDVASITKVASTTLALMKLYDDGLLDINEPLKTYLPELDTTNKGDLIIKDILAHHAKLVGWIPFYKSTKTDQGRLSGEWYRRKRDEVYDIKVANGLYLRRDYYDTIFQMVVDSELREEDDYRYSDLGFYIFERIIRKLSGEHLDEYLNRHFYVPLGLRHTTFNPLENDFAIQHIPPTEEDSYFRTQTVQGYVHDMGAAMMGGIAGHAGLFSNAHDLAIIFQMLINGGNYGGRQYLRPQTIRVFANRYERSSRRGLGFDMKEVDTTKVLNMTEEASDATFGHLGFTGTAIWADPKNDLIFVFLSNRTYPSMKNNTLQRENYRPRMQSLAYRALLEE